ncbi:hypothetical protein Tco_1521382, partial [Tanacetum coccineum]
VRFYRVKDQQSQFSPISAPSTSQPPTSPSSMQTTHVAEEAATMPHDSPLLRVYSFGSDEGSMTLNELTKGQTYKEKKLEHKVKSSKARRRVRLVVSENEDELEDPSKYGRKIAQIDEDGGITLVQMSAQTQGRHEHDFEESDFEFITHEEDYTVEPDISTTNVLVSIAGAEVSTASPEVKIAAKNLVYIRRKKLNLFRRRQKLINERKRKFAQQRAEQRRNKPMTQAQQRTYMCNYINNMGSHTLQQLKKLSFDEIKELFETTMKRVNTFTPMESDDTVPKVVAGSSKRDAEQ